MNSLVKLFFSAVVAFGAVALPQTHATLIDFNGPGTSELGSNFSSSGLAETPGVGIGGSDGLASSALPGYGSGAVYTAEAFDMTSSTSAVASVLFYYDGGFHLAAGKGLLAAFDILSDSSFGAYKFSLRVEVSGTDGGAGLPGSYLVLWTGETSYYGYEKKPIGTSFTIVPDHWYRLTAGFTNENGAFRISGKLEDYGINGQQSVSILSEGNWRNDGSPVLGGANTIDTTLSTDSSAYLRVAADYSVTALDNFEFQGGQQVPEPSSAALLASAGLLVLSRRRSPRGAAR